MPHTGDPLGTAFLNAVRAFNTVAGDPDVDRLGDEYFDQQVTLYQLHHQGNFFRPKPQVVTFLKQRLQNNPRFNPGNYQVQNTDFVGAVFSNNATWTQGGANPEPFSFMFTFVKDRQNGWIFTGLDGKKNP